MGSYVRIKNKEHNIPIWNPKIGFEITTCCDTYSALLYLVLMLYFYLCFLSCQNSKTHNPDTADVLIEPASPIGSAVIKPYLQHATSHSIWILWETENGTESRIEWGESNMLGHTSVGTHEEGVGYLHQVELTELSPDTTYYYQAHSEDYISPVYHFRTPPDHSSDELFRILAMSDMQKDSSFPEQYAHMIEHGVLPELEKENHDLSDSLAMVLIPGDLVDNGWVHAEWYDDFFTPTSSLLSYVPVYPVPGNHEGNTPFFWRYFLLPENGSPGYEEHWWHKDYNNVRIIGLDSNTGYRIETQLDWLDDLLTSTCQQEEIDFVFAQLHHPFLSELWTPGETDFTGEVIQRLETFTDDCHKPSIHFFGHTHGYSRGQSLDHKHLWVNVASAGGALDRWGFHPQQDYPEFSVSEDEYGFVLVEVQPGSSPSFTVKRVSLGTPENPKDNEYTDEVVIHFSDEKPETPSLSLSLSEPQIAVGLQLQGSPFSDPDGDKHGATQWELHSSCTDFSQALFQRWLQHENRYMGEDLNENIDLSILSFPDLDSNTEYCLRFRYRDRGLTWSDWSTGIPFSTEP